MLKVSKIYLLIGASARLIWSSGRSYRSYHCVEHGSIGVEEADLVYIVAIATRAPCFRGRIARHQTDLRRDYPGTACLVRCAATVFSKSIRRIDGSQRSFRFSGMFNTPLHGPETEVPRPTSSAAPGEGLGTVAFQETNLRIQLTESPAT